MRRVWKREQAKRDMIGQWVWYAENADVETADRFLTEAESALKLLAAQPGLGSLVFRKRAELRDLRRWPVSENFRQIFLFYLPHKNGIELVRVIHGKRNLETLLEEGPIR